MAKNHSILPTAAHRPKGMDHSSMLWFSRHGLGKTTLFNQIDDGLSVDLEGGTRLLHATAVEPRSWEEVIGVLDALETENHGFRAVSIDTADRAWSLLEEYVCRELGVPHMGAANRGKDWALAKARWSRFVYRVINLKAADGRKIFPVFICHEKLIPMTERRNGAAIETGRSLVSVNLPNSAKVILCSAVDFVFHLFLDEETGRRMLRTQAVDTPEYRIEAKGRGEPGCELPPVIYADPRSMEAEFKKAFDTEGGTSASS